mgnify:CR=1 FL=1
MRVAALEWQEGAPSPFSKVLVANRGEIACRVIRACRELGLETVAVHSRGDANALHVELADEAVLLEGDLSATYLSIGAIMRACAATGAEAVHPGYGFLSERAEFAHVVEAAGIVWVGPPASAIESMGDKVAARRLMRDAGVPVTPGGELSESDDLPARTHALQQLAARIGFPLLLKASAGGGGKGMRTVHSAGELDAAYVAAQREALSAFGDGTVYVEALLETPRHIEVQVLADSDGSVIHLLERECSVQRRHQKVVEEAPSAAIDEETRAAMGSAAVAAARAVNSLGAGTVEFLVAADGSFHFLEMNTRIQVEHPVTEMITGVDLVQEQLRIAAGLPLSISQSDISASGHAIEARIYAEDPANQFLPAGGRLVVWDPPVGPGVRIDAGVREGDDVSLDYDPMLAKLVVHAEDRPSCIERMAQALSRFVVLGATTNIEFLRDVVSHPGFAAAETTTDFISRCWPEGWSSDAHRDSGPPAAVLLAAAAEQLALHRTGVATSAGAALAEEDVGPDPYNPFLTLSRSFP